MNRDYFLQFQRFGLVVKVTAIDPVSGIEIILQGPSAAGEAALSQAAVRKLEYVIRQRQGK